MDGVVVKAGAVVKRCILAEDVVVGAGAKVGGEGAIAHVGTCLDHDTVHQHGVLNGSALFHNNACAQHRVLDRCV